MSYTKGNWSSNYPISKSDLDDLEDRIEESINELTHYTYVINSQDKFNTWVSNDTSTGNDYSYIAIIGGKGSGSNGEYELNEVYYTSSTNTNYIKGFCNATIKTTKLIYINGATVYDMNIISNIPYSNIADYYRCIQGSGRIHSCNIDATIYDLNISSGSIKSIYTVMYSSGSIIDCDINLNIIGNFGSSNVTFNSNVIYHNGTGALIVSNCKLSCKITNSISNPNVTGIHCLINNSTSTTFRLYATNIISSFNVPTGNGVTIPTTYCSLNQLPNSYISSYAAGGMDLLYQYSSTWTTDSSSSTTSSPATNAVITLNSNIKHYGHIVICYQGCGDSNYMNRKGIIEFTTASLIKIQNTIEGTKGCISIVPIDGNSNVYEGYYGFVDSSGNINYTCFKSIYSNRIRINAIWGY